MRNLSAAAIFSGISTAEIESMLVCLGAREQAYKKGQFVLSAGDKPNSVGLILSGGALIIQEDFWGARNILAKLAPLELFAESFACAPEANMNVSVVADDALNVLWLEVSRILSACPSACTYHSRIIRNLISEIANKNLKLNERMTHMGKRTTRQKALSYLSQQARRQGKAEFDIVFSRQQLADYLSVERSALSAELSKLRDEGLIDFDKNHFVLVNDL